MLSSIAEDYLTNPPFSSINEVSNVAQPRAPEASRELKSEELEREMPPGYSCPGVKKSSAGVRACICRTYPIFTPDKVIAYAERIRFTPNDLLLVYRRIIFLVYTIKT